MKQQRNAFNSLWDVGEFTVLSLAHIVLFSSHSTIRHSMDNYLKNWQAKYAQIVRIDDEVVSIPWTMYYCNAESRCDYRLKVEIQHQRLCCIPRLSSSLLRELTYGIRLQYYCILLYISTVI